MTSTIKRRITRWVRANPAGFVSTSTQAVETTAVLAIALSGSSYAEHWRPRRQPAAIPPHCAPWHRVVPQSTVARPVGVTAPASSNFWSPRRRSVHGDRCVDLTEPDPRRPATGRPTTLATNRGRRPSHRHHPATAVRARWVPCSVGEFACAVRWPSRAPRVSWFFSRLTRCARRAMRFAERICSPYVRLERSWFR